MKHTLLSSWLAILMSLVCQSLPASDFVADGIYYNISSSQDLTVEVTRYSYYSGGSYSGSVEIPESVLHSGNTYRVTSIGPNAFNCCSNLTSITIPSSVTSIGESAFYSCSNLTSISIPSSVTSIGGAAFNNCSKLTSISIPSSVTSIGKNAFENCSSLTKAEFASIESLCSIQFGDYSNPLSYANNLYIAGNLVTEVTIPKSVTNIGSQAFYRYSNLTSITIPSSVTSIGKSAFSYCSNLTSITIPSSVTSIGESAFNGCSHLSSITFEGSDVNIGTQAFSNCYNLTRITALSEVPPHFVEGRLFKCSTDYVRDAYDVYTYATLHVPMGSAEAYASAHEWRYFNKVKEDMETNGKVYYAKLSLRQGTIGYTEQNVKADEPYTLYIGALNNCKVNAVTFNEEDVTDQLVDGYYTTPRIKGASVLTISYEDMSSIHNLEASNIRITAREGAINISNIDEPSDVSVYSADGKLVDNVTSAFGNVSVDVPNADVYVIKVGQRTFKIAM